MGNEAGILGKDKSRCEGGVMVAGPQDITSLILDADRLSATLAGNLVCGITEAITTKSVLFFEAPTEVTAHIDDPLYRFTASGAAAFLVWPGVGSDTSRVLRAPLPVPPDVTKKLMMSARLSDPHVLRALQPAGTPDANNSNKGIIAFSSGGGSLFMIISANSDLGFEIRIHQADGIVLSDMDGISLPAELLSKE
jgi:hypothetical protein